MDPRHQDQVAAFPGGRQPSFELRLGLRPVAEQEAQLGNDEVKVGDDPGGLELHGLRCRFAKGDGCIVHQIAVAQDHPVDEIRVAHPGAVIRAEKVRPKLPWAMISA